MSSDNFYKDEYQFLKDQSILFADAFPYAIQFLTDQSTDPDVERTIEGFAFLTGQLHEKIAKEYPQLTQGLIDMLWPSFLQPIPSITIVEFSTKNDRPEKIKTKTALLSQETHFAPNCSFETARDLTVLPAKIIDVKIDNIIHNNSLIIQFEMMNNATLSCLHNQSLRLYLGNDSYTGNELYLWLLNYLDNATLICDENSYKQPLLTISPVGFENRDAILRYSQNTYMGYRLLQEYLCFPEGYLFVDINNFELPQECEKSQQFSLRFRFTRPLPERIKFNKNVAKLNCTPAINLFSSDCEPINLDGKHTHYPLITRYGQKQFYEIFSVDKVTGWINAPHLTQKTRSYSTFENFRHQHEEDKNHVPLYYKLLRKQPLSSDHIDYSLAFIRGDELHCTGYDETISIKATCCNGDEAAKLGIGAINQFKDETLAPQLQVRNITRPSLTLRPEIQQVLHWTTISNLSLNYFSLLNKEGFAQILRSYNMAAPYSKQAERAVMKIIDNIESFTTKPIQIYYRDLLINGLESTIEINQSAFNSEGELFLFGNVIAYFYSLFATVNSFHNLIIVNTSNQERYSWPSMIK